jgi:uncharacterized protein YraI
LICALVVIAGTRQSLAQPLPQAAPTDPAPVFFEGRVTGAESLNLRTGPHFSYTAVAYLMEGEQVRLVGRNRAATWFQIELYNGYRGWVNARYIAPNAAIAALPVADVPLLGLTAFVTNDPILVYAGPGRLHTPVAIAQPGQMLVLNARNDTAGWVFAFLPDGRAGWLPADSPFLPSAPLNNLPIITPFSDALPYPAAYHLVYTGPGYLFEPIFRVDTGQQLTIRGRTDDARWVLVRLADGREGWLTADIIQLGMPLEQLPIIPGIAPPQAVSWQPAAATDASGAGKGTPLLPATTPSETPTVTSSPTPTATPTDISAVLATATATTGTPIATPGLPTAATDTPTATRPAMTSTPTATATRNAPLPTVTPIPATATTATGIPVYRTPDDSTAPMVLVTPGQSVVILGRTADSRWIKIELPGDLVGWVRSEDIQLNIELALLPVIAP